MRLCLYPLLKVCFPSALSHCDPARVRLENLDGLILVISSQTFSPVMLTSRGPIMVSIEGWDQPFACQYDTLQSAHDFFFRISPLSLSLSLSSFPFPSIHRLPTQSATNSTTLVHRPFFFLPSNRSRNLKLKLTGNLHILILCFCRSLSLRSLL